MSDVVTVLLVLLIIYTLYFNLLASIIIKYDSGLNNFQKTAQSIIIWCIPVFGACLILHLLFKSSPKTIPRKWIPWPFKNLIYGPPIKRYNDAPPRRTGGFGR